MGYLVLAGIVLTFLTSLLGFVLSFRKIQAVHVLVNAQLDGVMTKLTAAVDRSDQLRETLRAADVPVPARPDDKQTEEPG